MRRKAGATVAIRAIGAVFVAFAALMVIGASPAAWAVCEFCNEKDAGLPNGGAGIIKPCYDPEVGDLCNDPPPPCVDDDVPPFKLTWDEAGQNPVDMTDPKSQIWVTNTREQHCVYIHGVTKTGYYRLFDDPLAESCEKQLDETAYVTVTNSCSANGWAVQANVNNRFVVMDSDNTPLCEVGECEDGFTCRPGNADSTCCVPDQKAFVGTFFLVAGEANKLCLNSWCADWLVAKNNDGTDLGFVINDCKDINSVHLFLSDSFVGCEADTMLKPCNWGCEGGKCLPDPCDAKDCPAFCKDGVCLDKNPCLDLTCEHGCKNGRCLQPPSTPGPDGDGDKFPYAADCDDDNPDVHPGKREQCDNGIDDNCDGQVDENCSFGDLGPLNSDGSPGGGDGGPGGSDGNDDGCGCAVDRDPPLWPLMLLTAVLPLWWWRRRRGNTDSGA